VHDQQVRLSDVRLETISKPRIHRRARLSVSPQRRIDNRHVGVAEVFLGRVVLRAIELGDQAGAGSISGENVHLA
jgi:hypothetical protein